MLQFQSLPADVAGIRSRENRPVLMHARGEKNRKAGIRKGKLGISEVGTLFSQSVAPSAKKGTNYEERKLASQLAGVKELDSIIVDKKIVNGLFQNFVISIV